MMNISVICVGKLKEPHYIKAIQEYEKRLTSLAKFKIIELNEYKLPQNPSESEVQQGLEKEMQLISSNIPQGALLIPMCIEGKGVDSVEFAKIFEKAAVNGNGKLCFLIGSSFGLHEKLKAQGYFKLSMSKMTFPHHLARVMLVEQIYRALMINEGTKYHK